MPPPNIPAPSNTSAPPVATRGDEDPQSPTVMLQSYLRSRGLPLTAQNMQRVLMGNAQGSTIVPGLVNEAPTTDPGVGQQGNIAGKVEQAPRRGLPVPPIPPQSLPTPPIPPASQVVASTPPAANVPQPSSLVSNIDLNAGGLGPAILGAGGAGAALLANRYFGGAAPPTPTPQDAQTGDRFDVTPTDQSNPLSAALNRAVQPSLQMGQGSPTDIPLTVPRPPIPNRTLDIPPAPQIPVPPGMVRNPDGSIGVPGGGFHRAPVRAGRVLRGFRVPG